MGTLDYCAAGKLVLLTDGDTKRSQQSQDAIKGYFFTLLLGQQTITDDIYGKAIVLSASHSSEDILKLAVYVLGLEGEYSQYAPMISAKRTAGKRDYNRYRHSQQYSMGIKKIHSEILSVKLIDLTDRSISFAVDAKGCFYVRALCGTALRLFDIQSCISYIYRYRYDYDHYEDLLNKTVNYEPKA